MFEAIIIVIMAGLSIGSFVNVCAFRIPRGISLLEPSFCPQCRRRLGWHELVPVVSYLLQHRTCSSCSSRISLRYPGVELFVGLLTVVLFLVFGPTLQCVLVSVFTVLMILIAIIDWQHLIIPDKIIATGLALGIGFKTLLLQDEMLSSMISSLCSLSSMLLLLLLGNWLFEKETMGMGDVKLAGLIGFYLGFGWFLAALWLASLVGSFYGLSRKATHSKGKVDHWEKKLPFGSFLALTSSAIMILIHAQTITFDSLIASWLTFLK